MEDFPAEDLHDIISIQIHLQQYGNDFKWMCHTHDAFLKNILHCWIKKNCASVIYDYPEKLVHQWSFIILHLTFGYFSDKRLVQQHITKYTMDCKMLKVIFVPNIKISCFKVRVKLKCFLL